MRALLLISGFSIAAVAVAATVLCPYYRAGVSASGVAEKQPLLPILQGRRVSHGPGGLLAMGIGVRGAVLWEWE